MLLEITAGYTSIISLPEHPQGWVRGRGQRSSMIVHAMGRSEAWGLSVFDPLLLMLNGMTLEGQTRKLVDKFRIKLVWAGRGRAKLKKGQNILSASHAKFHATSLSMG